MRDFTDYVFRVGTDLAEHRFRTMPAKDTNTLHFVSGGDCGLGSHPRATNRLALGLIAGIHRILRNILESGRFMG